LKKRNPDLCTRAKKIKEKYGVPWNIAIVTAKGLSPLPPVKTKDFSHMLESCLRELVEPRH
jgi:hypothetical protein